MIVCKREGLFEAPYCLARKEILQIVHSHIDKMGSIPNQFTVYILSLSLPVLTLPHPHPHPLSLSRMAFSELVRSHARHPRQATPALAYTGVETQHIRAYIRVYTHIAQRHCGTQGLIIHVISTPYHKESATGIGRYIP